MTNAMLYLRQSEDRSGEGAALDRQRTDALQLAQIRGWTVVAEHRDNDTSASGKVHRKGFEAILNAIAAGTVDVVIAWDMSRLTRNSRDRVRLMEAGRAAGTVLAFVRGSDMDLSTPSGRFSAGILAEVAQMEIDQKADRQIRANVQRAANGISRWSVRPFALDRDGDRVVEVRDEADALRRAAKAVLAGDTLASIVRTMNADGFVTVLGKPFTVTTLRRCLTNRRYAGRSTYRGQDVAAADSPVILSVETIDLITEKLHDPKRRLQQSTELRYLMSGGITCGLCGGTCYTQPQIKNGKRWISYMCRKGRDVARNVLDVDPLIEAVVLERLRRPDAVSVLVPDVDLDALRAQAVQLRERRDTIADMVADGLLDGARARTRALGIAEDLRSLERQIDAQLGESPAGALAAAPDLDAAWGAMTKRQQRQVVDSLMVVTLFPQGRGNAFDPDTVRIEWTS